MPSLSWRSARAICCKAWGITPPAFDALVADDKLCVGDIVAQVDLEIISNPRTLEFAYPGTMALWKKRRYEQQNKLAFEALYAMANKNKKGAIR